MTTAAETIRPWCFARITTPRVPMLGMPRVRAHRRLAASSRMAVQSPRARATARTAVSPAPRPHSSTATGTRGTATRVPQPLLDRLPRGIRDRPVEHLRDDRLGEQDVGRQCRQECEVPRFGQGDHGRRIHHPPIRHASLPRGSPPPPPGRGRPQTGPGRSGTHCGRARQSLPRAPGRCGAFHTT